MLKWLLRHLAAAVGVSSGEEDFISFPWGKPHTMELLKTPPVVLPAKTREPSVGCPSLNWNLGFGCVCCHQSPPPPGLLCPSPTQYHPPLAFPPSTHTYPKAALLIHVLTSYGHWDCGSSLVLRLCGVGKSIVPVLGASMVPQTCFAGHSMVL